jgi:hypothetical protein
MKHSRTPWMRRLFTVIALIMLLLQNFDFQVPAVLQQSVGQLSELSVTTLMNGLILAGSLLFVAQDVRLGNFLWRENTTGHSTKNSSQGSRGASKSANTEEMEEMSETHLRAHHALHALEGQTGPSAAFLLGQLFEVPALQAQAKQGSETSRQLQEAHDLISRLLGEKITDAKASGHMEGMLELLGRDPVRHDANNLSVSIPGKNGGHSPSKPVRPLIETK